MPTRLVPILTLLAFSASVAPALAQQLPPPTPERVERFDPRTLTVRRVDGHWQLLAANAILHDFGTDQTAATAAAKVLRRLQVNQHGTVGTSAVVLDYWLCDGRPPELSFATPTEVTFDLSSLTIDSSVGTWQLRDGGTVLLDFGADAADAALALAVCKKYGFNRLGRIGSGTSWLTYLIADSRTSAGFAPDRPGTRHLLTVLPQRYTRGPLVLPKVGVVGDTVGFDARRLECRKNGDGEWALLADGYELERFGSDERAARSAARILIGYGATEQCRVGTGSAELRFYLANGRSLRCVRSGLASRPLPADLLQLQQEGEFVELRCRDQTVFAFGTDRATAERALAAIRHFGLDAVAEDRESPRGLRVLVRTGE